MTVRDLMRIRVQYYTIRYWVFNVQ